MNISRLEKVELRDLWKHEAHGFTHWLADNLDYLGDALGVSLTFVEREASGDMSFSADLKAEDPDGNAYVIENQLEKTDHDHLGKIITYMSNLDAKIAVWITREPRPEHEKAVHWLNEILPADSAVYLVKLEAYRIAESPAAPLFTVVAGPTPVARQVGHEKKKTAQSHALRRSFWEQLLRLSNRRTSLFANISPGRDIWISASAGRSGFAYGYVLRKSDAQVELFIATGDTERNKRYFDQLHARKATIDAAFGQPLQWERLENRQGCRIRYVFHGKGFDHPQSWPEIQDKMVDAMVRLSAALTPEIGRL